jgi:hypothetical protein
MNLRRFLAAAGLVAVAATALSGCGQKLATDRPNTIANGGYDVATNGMHVDAARIVASADGQGVFVATISLDPTQDAVTQTKQSDEKEALTGIAAGPGASVTLTASGSIHKVVNTEGVANLNDPKVGGIPVTGTFKAGDIVPVKLTFAGGATATVNAPVVTDCFEYSGAGTSTYSLPSADPSPSVTSSPGTYECAYPAIQSTSAAG